MARGPEEQDAVNQRADEILDFLSLAGHGVLDSTPAGAVAQVVYDFSRSALPPDSREEAVHNGLRRWWDANAHVVAAFRGPEATETDRIAATLARRRLSSALGAALRMQENSERVSMGMIRRGDYPNMRIGRVVLGRVFGLRPESDQTS